MVITLAVAGWWDERCDEKGKEEERKQREHEAWLQSPEGTAFQAAEREKQRRQEEEQERHRREAERQRRDAEEMAARAKWRMYHESKTMADIDKMTGMEFEDSLELLFWKLDYTEIAKTPSTNDDGADLICRSPCGVRVAVQAKRWSDTVGKAAVQEVFTAAAHYKCTEAMVVTNSTFTPNACELAKSTGVILHDRQWLAEQIKRHFPAEMPEFDWEKYRRVIENVRHVKDARVCPACHAPMRRIKSKYKRGRHFFGCSRYPACDGKARELSAEQIEFERHHLEQERLKRQAEAANQARAAAEAARKVAEEWERATKQKQEEERQRQEAERIRREQERLKSHAEDAVRRQQEKAKREQEEECQRHEGDRLRREQERLKRQAEEAVRRRQQEAAERTERDSLQEEERREEPERARDVPDQNRGQQRDPPSRAVSSTYARRSSDLRLVDSSERFARELTPVIAEVIALCRRKQTLRLEELWTIITREFFAHFGTRPTHGQLVAIEAEVVDRRFEAWSAEGEENAAAGPESGGVRPGLDNRRTIFLEQTGETRHNT